MKPRIAIPEPVSSNPSYCQANWPRYAHAIECAGGIAIPVPLSESQSTVARLANTCQGILLPGSPADVDPERYGQKAIAACNPKDAARESADELLLQDAFNLHKPILGICYGVQSLNVWRNGTLIQDLPKDAPKDSPRTSASANAENADDRGKARIQSRIVNHQPGREVHQAHVVAGAPGSLLAQILSDAADVQLHEEGWELFVNSSHHQAIGELGSELRIVAGSPDDGVVEAVEGPPGEQFILGVQWHPERNFSVSPASRAIFAAFVAAAAAWRPREITESISRQA